MLGAGMAAQLPLHEQTMGISSASLVGMLGLRHSQEHTLGPACQQLFLTPLPSPPCFPWDSLELGLWQVRGNT